MNAASNCALAVALFPDEASNIGINVSLKQTVFPLKVTKVFEMLIIRFFFFLSSHLLE